MPLVPSFLVTASYGPPPAGRDLNRRIHAGSGYIQLIDAGKIAPLSSPGDFEQDYVVFIGKVSIW